MNQHLYDQQQLKVLEFHKLIGAYCGEWPHVPPVDIRKLREALIEEEFKEFLDASADGNIVKVADGLADLLVVIYGAANAWGIALEPIFNEVHESNMTKEVAPINGKGVRGPNYRPPELEPLLEAQIPKDGTVPKDWNHPAWSM